MKTRDHTKVLGPRWQKSAIAASLRVDVIAMKLYSATLIIVVKPYFSVWDPLTQCVLPRNHYSMYHNSHMSSSLCYRLIISQCHCTLTLLALILSYYSLPDLNLSNHWFDKSIFLVLLIYFLFLSFSIPLLIAGFKLLWSLLFISISRFLFFLFYLEDKSSWWFASQKADFHEVIYNVDITVHLNLLFNFTS